MGSSTKKTEATSTPFQQDQISTLLDGATQNYLNQKDTPLPQQQYASLNADQNGAIDYIKNWINGTGSSLAGQASTAAGTSYGALNPFIQNASNFANGNTGVTSGADAGQVSAYKQAALGALGSGTQYANNAQSLFNNANADPTQANIAAATAYANNPYVQGEIDAASRDVTRNLYENEIPSLNMAASAGGNLNSSRAGAAEAVAMRGASDRISDTSTNIRNNAYNTGLNLAEQARSTNLNAANSANSQLGNYANMGFSNVLSGMNFGEGQRQFDTSTRVDANNQLGTAAGMGNQSASTANSMITNLYGQYADAGATQQADQQAVYDTVYNNLLAEYNKDSNSLATYKSLIDGDYGGTEKTKTKEGGNTLGTIAGLAATVAAAYFTGGASLAVQGAATAAKKKS